MCRPILKHSILSVFVFVLSTSILFGQSASTLYSFGPTSNNYAQEPIGLVADAAGNLYGVLQYGGDLSCATAGCGEVYELVSPGGSFGVWTEQVLYQFAGGSDGCTPSGQLTMDATGALYGVTTGAGCSKLPTIFKLSPSATPPWTLLTIYSSSKYVNAVLALNPAGDVFASTSLGAIELIKPATSGGTWHEKQIAFISGIPSGGLQFFAGNLYGTTYQGGAGFGSAFELSPPAGGSGLWSTTEIASFNGGTDGSGPGNSSVLGLSVLSATQIFGITQGVPPCALPGECGTVYELLKQPNGTWTRTVLYGFEGADGALPETVTASDNGKYVFGTTYEGGIGSYSQGTVFQLTAPAKGGASWTKETFDFTKVNQGFPGGNVLVDETGLTVYTTEDWSGSVLEMQFPIPVVPPYLPAGDILTLPCVQVSYPSYNSVKFSNSCSRRVDFWACAGASSVPNGFCLPVANNISSYVPSFLNSMRSFTLTVDTYNDSAGGNALECRAGWYPVLYTDNQGTQYLDCGRPPS